MENPLIHKKYQLKKFPGKGGWTYAEIPEILPDKKAPFGWVRVKGFIDDYEIKAYHLMPMGNGRLFLPVKSQIRKKIKKEEGDWIFVKLFLDRDPLSIPNEFIQCLRDEPLAHDAFFKLSEGEQKQYIDWIYQSKKEETQAERISKTINQLLRNKPNT